MMSKQVKDFIDSIKYVELEDTIPFVMMDMSKLPKGSDFDIDKTFDDIPMGVFIEEYKKQPLRVFKSKPSLEEAIEVLCNELEDKDYYKSWKYSIAMAFYDEFRSTYFETYGLDIHKVANNAADNFLKQLMK